MDHSINVVRIGALARKLQKKTANSFADKQEIYLLATDIMLEANEIRRGINNARGRSFDYWWLKFARLLGFRRV